MRFAYIDSNGNEIPIPSVDALALRVELGAITSETQLYDAQADQWGPAHTHEIYHSLARASGADTGLIPAPPAAAPDPQPTDEAGSGAQPPTKATDGKPRADTEHASEEKSVGTADDDGSPQSAVAGLTLAAPPPPPPEEEPLAKGVDSDAGRTTEHREEGGFDFGDLSGGLELEDGDEGEGETMLDFSGALEEPVAPDSGEGLDFETALEFSSGGFDASVGGELDLEAPMSEFTPGEPPAWMEKEEAAAGPEVMDLSSVTGPPAEPVARASEPARTPRSKPSPPRLRTRRNLAPPLIGIILLLAVGMGGYAAWPVISGRLAEPEEDPGPVLPDLPPELMPQMREIAAVALEMTYDRLHGEWISEGPVREPGSDWLGGRYLAEAGRYAEAEAFWSGMQELVELAAKVDPTALDESFADELVRRGVAEGDASRLRARAEAGFAAASGARAELGGRMVSLVESALQLHTFLLANEASIEYTPASRTTTEAVLEATAATAELHSAMEGLIDRVTDALLSLEYRDQVTADGLWRSFIDQVKAAGIQ